MIRDTPPNEGAPSYDWTGSTQQELALKILQDLRAVIAKCKEADCSGCRQFTPAEAGIAPARPTLTPTIAATASLASAFPLYSPQIDRFDRVVSLAASRVALNC